MLYLMTNNIVLRSIHSTRNVCMDVILRNSIILGLLNLLCYKLILTHILCKMSNLLEVYYFIPQRNLSTVSLTQSIINL